MGGGLGVTGGGGQYACGTDATIDACTRAGLEARWLALPVGFKAL